MSGSSIPPGGGLSTDQTTQIDTMQTTYANAQLFESTVTTLKLLGDTKLDAIKQRPQV